MAKTVQHAITVKGIIYGTAYVKCAEDDHRPEKLIHDIEWDTENIEWHEVVDSEIVDAWDEEDEEE